MGSELPPMHWHMAKLGELGEVNRGRSRHRPRDASHLYGGPYPFIQTGDIKNSGGRITSFTQTYSEDGLAQSRLWPAQTMCITIAANIAETALLSFPACFPDSVVGFIADKNKCDVRFIEYAFRRLRQSIQREATGSVQDNINLQTLARLSFAIPSLQEQVAIADVLGALDDRIDNLRATNATLEAIAQALFKSWFVDFDPVRAKAEGRAPEGMDAATAALFPSEFEDSELGQVPKGWRIGRSSELFSIVGGGTPKTSVAEFWNGNIPWFSVVDVPAPGQVFVMRTEKSVTATGLKHCSAKLLPPRSTIISARGTVGKVAMTGVPMVTNQSCYGLRPAVEGAEAFVYFATCHIVGQLQQITHGAVFDTITRTSFDQVTAAVPPSEVILAFCASIDPLLSAIHTNGERIVTLTELRDALLPRLISGKLRVLGAAVNDCATGAIENHNI